MPGRLTRLTRRGEFLKVAGRGRKAARPGLVLQALPQPRGGLRLGFTATKKIGNAVARNRAKRRLREAARLMLGAAPPAGWDLVLVARDATGGAGLAEAARRPARRAAPGGRAGRGRRREPQRARAMTAAHRRSRAAVSAAPRPCAAPSSPTNGRCAPSSARIAVSTRAAATTRWRRIGDPRRPARRLARRPPHPALQPLASRRRTILSPRGAPTFPARPERLTPFHGPEAPSCGDRHLHRHPAHLRPAEPPGARGAARRARGAAAGGAGAAGGPDPRPRAGPGRPARRADRCGARRRRAAHPGRPAAGRRPAAAGHAQPARRAAG